MQNSSFVPTHSSKQIQNKLQNKALKCVVLTSIYFDIKLRSILIKCWLENKKKVVTFKLT